MSETPTEVADSSPDSPENLEKPGGEETVTLYVDAVEEYLEAADWLTAADAPLKVHARAIARSLDRQLEERGEIQSALASSFDKVLMRLDTRRPAPTPAPPGLGDRGPMGEQSVFDLLDDTA